MNFKSQLSQNKYLFSSRNKQFIILHPLLELMESLDKLGIVIDNWIKDAPEEFVLSYSNKFNKAELMLGYQKYLLLKQNGYFLKSNIENKITGRLTSDLVKQTLANTSSVVFEVTEKCNLACDYCCYSNIYGNYSKRKFENLPLEKATRLLDYIFELRNSSLNKSYANKLQIGFYGGEPLLNISFIDGIIKYLKSKEDIRNCFALTMTTNGVLLDKYMDYIVENDIHFSVSLDGNRENNSFRVFQNKSQSFDIVFSNLKAIQNKYPEYFEDHVRVLSVLHSRNSIKETSEFIKKEFNNDANISEVNPIGINADKLDEFYKIYKNPLENLEQQENYTETAMLKTLNYSDRTTVTKTIHQHCFSVFKNYSQLMFGNLQNENIIPTATCLPFHYKTFLTVSGNILPCEKIGHQFSLGTIGEDKIVNIDFDKIAKMYNEIYDKLDTQCSNCSNVMMCGQCVFNLKDIECEKPKCNGCLTESEFVKYLTLQLSYLEKYPSQYSFIMKKIIGR